MTICLDITCYRAKGGFNYRNLLSEIISTEQQIIIWVKPEVIVTRKQLFRCTFVNGLYIPKKVETFTDHSFSTYANFF